MKTFIIGFICFTLGTWFGIIIMCIFQIKKSGYTRMERMFEERIKNEQNE